MTGFNLIKRDKIGPSLQASKWLICPMLIEIEEMQSLFSILQPFWIFLTSGIISSKEAVLSQEEFLDCYSFYLKSLKEGKEPEDKRIRQYFSAILTSITDAVYSVQVGEDKQLIKVQKPVVQMQNHKISYSKVDGKFRSMMHGPDSMWWGIQFSFPQIYEDQTTMQIKYTKNEQDNLNFHLWRRLQKWMRQMTVPTPFLVESQKINVPVRLGKQCFSWVNSHPQLINSQIKVIV